MRQNCGRGLYISILSNSREEPVTLHPPPRSWHGAELKEHACRWQVAVVILDITEYAQDTGLSKAEPGDSWLFLLTLFPQPCETGMLGQFLPSWNYPQRLMMDTEQVS